MSGYRVPMANLDDDFLPYRAGVLGALVYRQAAGLPVEIELEDADGNVLGSTYLLRVALFTEPDGRPTKLKILGRLSRPTPPAE